MRGRVVTIALGIVISVALAFVLAWLVEQAPWLGVVIMIAAAAALVSTLWRIAASPERLRTALSIALTFVCSLAAIVLLSALFATDDDVSAGPQSTTAPTISVATAPPTAPDTAAATGSEATDTSASTTTELSNNPVASTTTSEAATTTITTTTTTTTEPPPPDLTASIADGDDCECAEGDELTGLGVHADGDSIVFEIGAAGLSTGPIWIWSQSDPGRPLVIDPATDSDARVAGFALRIPATDAGPWAVVSSGGDRVPELGFAAAGDELSTVAGQGALAARLEAELAEAQRAVPVLDGARAQLVTSLIARQTLTSTVSFMGLTDENDVLVEVITAWPRFAQILTIDGVRQQSIHATVDEVVTCDPAGTGFECAPLDAGLPLSAAVAIARDPGATVIGEPTSDTHEGEPVTCLEVEAAPEGGPSTGTTCWLENGMATRTGRVVLTDLTLEVAVERLDPPGGE